MLGNHWYNNFIDCNNDQLTRKKALLRDVKRNSWVMYDNFVAAKLPDKVFRNMGGRIVDEEDAFGLPTEYVLTHPHMVVYVDKTG